MQGQVLMVVPSTFSLTLLWAGEKFRRVVVCECSFHSGYFVTSPSLPPAKMDQQVQLGPAFAQTWSTRRESVLKWENGKCNLI